MTIEAPIMPPRLDGKAVPNLFLRDQWYVVATSAEVGATPVARTVCNEPLVLFRRSDGSIAVLLDRCPHRKAPLSTGKVIGDEIQCGYHGARFAGNGACTLIPSQQDLPVPAGFSVTTFPAEERYALIFVWMGARERADPALIPDWSLNVAPGWKAVHGYHHVECHYQLLIDNLLDLSHVTYTHKSTVSGPGVDETPMEMKIKGNVVRTSRTIRNVDPVPMQRATMGWSGKIDRWLLSEFTAPGYVILRLGAAAAGQFEELEKPTFVIINSVTPETDRSVHYFWSVSRWQQLDDEKLTQTYYDMTAKTFDEDKVMIEDQQRLIDTDMSGSPLYIFRGDKGGVAARRIIARLLREEGDRAAT